MPPIRSALGRRWSCNILVLLHPINLFVGEIVVEVAGMARSVDRLATHAMLWLQHMGTWFCCRVNYRYHSQQCKRLWHKPGWSSICLCAAFPTMRVSMPSDRGILKAIFVFIKKNWQGPTNLGSALCLIIRKHVLLIDKTCLATPRFSGNCFS